MTGASTVALFGGLGGEEIDVDANTIMALGLGVSPPWKLVEQRLDTMVQPHVLHLEVAVDRGTMFACRSRNQTLPKIGGDHPRIAGTPGDDAFGLAACSELSG